MRCEIRSSFLQDKNTAPAIYDSYHDPFSFPTIPFVEISFCASPLFNPALSTHKGTSIFELDKENWEFLPQIIFANWNFLVEK